MSTGTLSSPHGHLSNTSRRTKPREETQDQDLKNEVRHQLLLVRKARPSMHTIGGLERVLDRILKYLENDDRKAPGASPPVADAPAVRRQAAATTTPNHTEAVGGIAIALARGSAAKAAWIRDGVLIGSSVLSEAWGMTPQALRQAAVRGELISLKVNNRLYYPARFAELDREKVAAVTQALGDLSAEEQLVFWMRPHGTLGGRTVFDALQEPSGYGRATRLAEGWVTEAGAARAAA